MKLAHAASYEPSRIRAIAGLAEGYPDTLRLFFGEDTLPTPDFIKNAGKRAVDENHTFYTPNAGYPSLRHAIASQFERLHGVAIDPRLEVVVTGSGMVAIALACQATVGPGDSALVITPLWPNLVAAVRLAGATPIEVPLKASDGSFSLDFDRLNAAVRPDSRLLALASPNNPTGWMASLEDWERVLDFCERHNLWLLADTVYDRICFEQPVASNPLALPRARSRTIIAQSFSKTYRMTGWRVGYTLAPAELTRAMTHLQEFIVSHAPGFVQEAARCALDDGEPFIRESQVRYARNRWLALERLHGIPGLVVPEPRGAFYLFPRFEGLANSQEFCEWLVRNGGVGLAPGSAFGTGGEGHIRLCFAVDEVTLDRALDRLEAGWLTYRPRLNSSLSPP